MKLSSTEEESLYAMNAVDANESLHWIALTSLDKAWEIADHDDPTQLLLLSIAASLATRQCRDYMHYTTPQIEQQRKVEYQLEDIERMT